MDEKQVGAKASLQTHEMDMKNSAISMIETFACELKGGFAPYCEQCAALMLPLITYDSSNMVRVSIAETLPHLIASIRAGYPDDKELHIKYGETFIEALWKATQFELETDTLVSQVHGIKEIVTNMGNFMDEKAVNGICEHVISMVKKSDERKEINDKVGAY